jgi:beta-lactamase regulating signal transducer with metallopeptidase domain
MTWHDLALEWLARAAAGGFVVLAAAALAVRLCRQPADRVRISGLALVTALCVPWLALLPGLPRWSLTVLPAQSDATPAAAPEPLATPWNPAADAARLAPADRPTAEPIPQPAKLKPEETTPPPASTAAASEPEPAAPVGPAADAARLAPAPVTAPASWSAARAVLVGYAVLTAVFVLWSLLGLSRLWLLWRSARPAPPDATALLREIIGSAAGGVRVLVSDRIDAPVAFAGWRPVIVLPASACDPDNRVALRYGLAHEWSHVERHDLARWHLATVAGLFFYWQPLFWWLRRQLRLGQDYLADALAARQAAASEDYAAYLVGLARRALGVPPCGALGIADRRSNLYRRVIMLVNNRDPLQRRCPGAWTLAAVAAAVLLVGAVSFVRLDAADPPKADKAAPAKRGAKDKDPKDAQGFNYTGTVTDKDTGKPIEGAVITVRRSVYGDPEVKEEDWIIQETKHKTDKDGKYSFTVPPEQSARYYLYIELDAEAPGHAPQKGFGYSFAMIQKNEKMGGRPFFESVTLRSGQEISGTIETPDGKPAAGVKVLSYSVTSKRKEGEFEYGSFADTKTDDKGRFALTVVTPGDCVFWVLPKKYAPSTHIVKDNHRGDVGKIALQNGIVLRGKALDAQGKPLPGLFVHADREGRDEALAGLFVADSVSRTALTNDKGEFEMAPLPAGTYRVVPQEQGYDPSDDGRQYKRRPLPAVFVGQRVALKEGDKPEPIEVRAVPHVVVEAQYYDSKGNPRRGHSPHIFGQIDGQSWFTEAKADENGKITVMAPHGLENAQLSLTTNEHGSLRFRTAKGQPLSRARQINLGTLDKDVKGVEIIRYDAPILLVKVTTKDGSKPKDVAVTALYPEEKGLREGRFIVKNGLNSDVTFEEQEDGRFRSSQLLPDEEVTVTAHAEGYAEASAKVQLAEGTSKDIEIVLEKK